MTECPWLTPCWIVCTPRSGSTWLADLLNRAAGVAEDDNPLPWQFKEHYHPKRSDWLADGLPVVTKCHVHWIDEHVPRLPPLETRIVLLTRENQHAQALSLIASGKTATHYADAETVADIRQSMAGVQTTVGEVWDHVAAIRRWERLARLLFQHHTTHLVTYEQLCVAPRETLDTLIERLGLLAEWIYDPSPLMRISPACEVEP